MDVLHRRCAGLDVHKDTVVACVRIQEGGKGVRETRTFGTTTSKLLELSTWMTECGCTHVVMESTGVYWKPVWHVLEGAFEQILANAGHVKAVPGRKTDVKDAEWLADLLAHGLVKGSFIVDTPIQEIRDLTRTRKQLVEERSRHVQRIQKTLQDGNVKLTSVVTDIMGATGRAVIEAIIDGELDPREYLKLKDKRIHATDDAFVDALLGRVTGHHRFLLRLHLGQIDALTASIGAIDLQLETLLAPFRPKVNNLKTIPGISNVLAAVIIGEVGADMRTFPTAGHLVSWAGLCPRNDESAGKRRSTRIRKGGTWLKPQLVQAAWSAVTKKNSYLRSLYHRIRSRRGTKKAIVAVAASMLTTIYHMLKHDIAYVEIGPSHFDRLSQGRTVNRLVQRLAGLGYEVKIKAAGSAA